jgi:hypothetical protein
LCGNLYEYYLHIIYNGGGSKVIDEAKDFVGADRAYFVINNYWENYREIKSRFLRAGAKVEEINGKTAIVIFIK